MKGIIICICVFLVLGLQASAASKAVLKGKPTYEELLLRTQRLEEKMDATVAIVQSIKAGLNARVSTVNTSLESAQTKWLENGQGASFYAYRSSTYYVSGSQKVVFNYVLYNVPSNQNSYNTITGIYRCPYDGTYVFYANIMGQLTSSSYKWYRFQIQKDGSTVTHVQGYVNSGSSSANYYETMSGMGVTKCKKGQSVYVKETYGYKQYIHRYSHFTGYRIA